MARLIICKRQKQAQYFTEDLGNGITMDMILIPGGTFFMGSPETELERFDREGPQHKVNVPSFFMGKYPVTQAQWKAIAEQTDLKENENLESEPSYFQEDYEKKDDRWTRPVEQVNWYQAKEFCARLSKKTNRQYRLPTEAEWEYACRAVVRNQSSVSSTSKSLVVDPDITLEEWNQKYHQPFHFGETISTEVANYDGNYTYGRGVKGEYRNETTPVGYFKVANEFGLYDMHGNVWEWCEDDWHNNYNGAPTDGSAWLESQEVDAKVIRGGSFGFYPPDCRSASRSDDGLARDGFSHYLGFRVVCVLPRTY